MHTRTAPSLACHSAAILFLALTLVLGGCRLRDRSGETGVDYDRQLAPGEVALVEVPPAEFPAFHLAGEDRDALRIGVRHSLTYLQAPSAKQHYPIAGITLEQTRLGLERFAELLDQALTDADLQRAIERQFRVYRSIGYDRRGSVLFTGYYVPIFEASRRRGGRFQHPLYKRPADLIPGPDGKTIAQQRLPDGSTRPYPTRAELETSGQLTGQELVWLADPFEAYVIQVQGSARLRLPDNSMLEIGYAGTNGRDYVAIGHELIADGRLREEDLDLETLRAFFQANPQLLDEYLHRNPRYVFFQEETGGPYGSLGQPVVPDVSIATDKAIFPRAALCWVDTSLAAPTMRPYSAFRLDQDTGGAIRAPGRVDLYMGVGRAAELRAGKQMAEGSLYYLVAK